MAHVLERNTIKRDYKEESIGVPIDHPMIVQFRHRALQRYSDYVNSKEYVEPIITHPYWIHRKMNTTV